MIFGILLSLIVVFRAHVRDRADGQIIENTRQFCVLRDRLEMLIKPFLCRFVVIRHHQQAGIHPIFSASCVDSTASAVLLLPVLAMIEALLPTLSSPLQTAAVLLPYVNAWGFPVVRPEPALRCRTI